MAKNNKSKRPSLHNSDIVDHTITKSQLLTPIREDPLLTRAAKSPNLDTKMLIVREMKIQEIKKVLNNHGLHIG